MPQHISRGRTEKERKASVSKETAWNNRDFVGCVGGTGREKERGRERKRGSDLEMQSIFNPRCQNSTQTTSIRMVSSLMNVIFGLRLMWVAHHTEAHTQTNTNKCVSSQSVTDIYHCEAHTDTHTTESVKGWKRREKM